MVRMESDQCIHEAFSYILERELRGIEDAEGRAIRELSVKKSKEEHKYAS